jgi:hypothetical protein
VQEEHPVGGGVHCAAVRGGHAQQHANHCGVMALWMRAPNTGKEIDVLKAAEGNAYNSG